MTLFAIEKMAAFAIASLMLVSGCVQLLLPELALQQIGVNEARGPALSLIATIGLLLAVLGGVLLQSLRSGEGQRSVLAWIALGKLLFVLLLVLGVRNGHYGAEVWPIAIFDGIALLLLLDLRRRQPVAGPALSAP